MIDLFTTYQIAKMPTFVSPIQDPEAYGVDSLSISNFYGYAYPLTAILHKVLEKIQRTTCLIILIAPLWPQQSWHARILELLVDLPICLPLS